MFKFRKVEELKIQI